MLEIGNSVLVIVDLQGKLANLMENRELLFKNTSRILQGAKLLDVPIIITEQNPDKLGPTITEIARLTDHIQPIKKQSFSCWGNADFVEALRVWDRGQVVLAGIETHVCVHQTAVDLMKAGYEVHIIADAVSSRTRLNYELSLERMKAEGAILSTTELALFEWVKTATHDRFKEMVKIIK